MAFITDLLAALGEHLPLLLVGCAEILLAVYLIGKFLWGKVQHKPSGKGRGAEVIFLQEWKRQSEEVCILLRRRDRMPVYTAGNLREVLFLATGALMSQTTFLQGESIPGIAHCVELGCPEEEGNT